MEKEDGLVVRETDERRTTSVIRRALSDLSFWMSDVWMGKSGGVVCVDVHRCLCAFCVWVWMWVWLIDQKMLSMG